MTVTTSPAASGSSRQPLISRITSRKSAATSAPETSRSAAFAAMLRPSGRLRRRDAPARRGAPRSATSDRPAPGATKIDSQPRSCVRIPPTAGPIEAPTIPASAQIRAAGASASSRLGEQVERGARRPRRPATPWSARAPTSTSNEDANAQRERRRREDDGRRLRRRAPAAGARGTRPAAPRARARG